MDYLIKTGDLFGVERRLKEIDGTYEVFYNKKLKRFEVYAKRMGKSFLAVVSPYETLDIRLVSYVRKTRVERADALAKEIEEENEKALKREKEREELLKKGKALFNKMMEDDG